MSVPVTTDELRARIPRDPALTRAMEQIAQAMHGNREGELLKMIAMAIAQAKPADISPALLALAKAIDEFKKNPPTYEGEITERDRLGRTSKWIMRPITRSK